MKSMVIYAHMTDDIITIGVVIEIILEAGLGRNKNRRFSH